VTGVTRQIGGRPPGVGHPGDHEERAVVLIRKPLVSGPWSHRGPLPFHPLRPGLHDTTRDAHRVLELSRGRIPGNPGCGESVRNPPSAGPTAEVRARPEHAPSSTPPRPTLRELLREGRSGEQRAFWTEDPPVGGALAVGGDGFPDPDPVVGIQDASARRYRPGAECL